MSSEGLEATGDESDEASHDAAEGYATQNDVAVEE